MSILKSLFKSASSHVVENAVDLAINATPPGRTLKMAYVLITNVRDKFPAFLGLIKWSTLLLCTLVWLSIMGVGVYCIAEIVQFLISFSQPLTDKTAPFLTELSFSIGIFVVIFKIPEFIRDLRAKADWFNLGTTAYENALVIASNIKEAGFSKIKEKLVMPQITTD